MLNSKPSTESDMTATAALIVEKLFIKPNYKDDMFEFVSKQESSLILREFGIGYFYI